MSAELPDPVRAWCDCGPTYVFLGYRMLPCGRCKQRVTFTDPGADRVR